MGSAGRRQLWGEHGFAGAQSLALLASALDHVSDAVVAADGERRIVYWGPGAERLYGVPSPAALGRPLSAMVRERWQKPEQTAAALEREGLWRGECVHVLPDGRELRVDSTVRVLCGEDGARLGLLMVSREAPPSVPDGRARARALLELVEVGCCVCRVALEGGAPVDLVVEEVNDAFAAQALPRREEMLGRSISDLFGSGDRDDGALLRRLLGAARTGAACRFVAMERSSGRWCSGEAHLLEPGLLALVLSRRDPPRESHGRDCAERFRAAAELFPGPLLVFDAQRRLCYANRAGLELPGLAAPPRSGGPAPPADLARVLPALGPYLDRAFSTGDVQRAQLSGAEGGLEASLAPLLDEAGSAREAVIALTQGAGRHPAGGAAGRPSLEACGRSAELGAVFDALGEAIVVFDAAGTVASVNAAARKLLGQVSPGMDSAGWARHVREVSRPLGGAPRDAVEPAPSRPLRGQSVSGEVWRLARPSGAEQIVEVTGAPLEVDGQRIGALVAMRDVTERQRAEAALRQSEQLFRTLAENLPDAVARFDPELRYLYANPAHRRAVLLPPKFAGASHAALGLVGEHLETLAALSDEVLATGRPAALETAFPHRGGPRHFEIRIVPELDPDRRVRSLLTVSRDVTEQKRAEGALRAANDRLEQADQRKNAFLATLSHELRNPLAPIRNSLYVLTHTAPESDAAQRARSVVERQVGQLSRLVDDLLDVTRIARGKLRLLRQALDLNQVVRRAAEDQRSVLARGGVELLLEIGDAPLPALGDPARIAQVVANLLQNAAKFTPRGGRAVVAVQRVRPGLARISVRDNGAGIAPEAQRHLFEPFVQAEQTLERSRSGLGLGLALVKGLVEQHGGAVEVRSAGLGQGAEFAVSLPLAAEGAAGERGASDLLQRGARRVLLVDGDEDAAAKLKGALESGDRVVEVAATGAEGLERARSFRPDAVLCELSLPGMDGCELARALRGEPELRGLLLVSLSGFATVADVERARTAGFDRHVLKPPDLCVLEKVLASAPEPS